MNTTEFTVYNKDNAPVASREWLAAVEAKFGFVPNVLGQMAESPAALSGSVQLMGSLEQTSLTPGEQWVALLVTAFHFNADYCVAANSTAAQMMGVPAPVIDAIRAGNALADKKFEALRGLVSDMVQHQGKVSQQSMQQFFDAGYSKSQLLEVIQAIAMETIASYTERALDTPLDEQYRPYTWSRPGGRAAT